MSILGDVRTKLSKLKWKNGLNREDIHKQWRNMPLRIYDLLPADYRFADAGAVMSYFEHLLQRGAIEELDLAGQPPSASVPSTTMARIRMVPHQHGVGSGGGSGYTGGGSVTSGIGREGTTYGDAEDEELEVEDHAESSSTE